MRTALGIALGMMAGISVGLPVAQAGTATLIYASPEFLPSQLLPDSQGNIWTAVSDTYVHGSGIASVAQLIEIVPPAAGQTSWSSVTEAHLTRSYADNLLTDQFGDYYALAIGVTVV